MGVKECPFCKEDIKSGAIKCKHCGSAIVDLSYLANGKKEEKKGTLWLPVPALIISIIFCLALFEDMYWSLDELVGALIFSILGLVVGIVSINVQKLGKAMAIAAVILSSIAGLSYIGMLVDFFKI